jgi:ribonuclease D
MYITDTAALEELLEHAGRAQVVGLDTEFMRERTYWARLCLIQLATDDTVAIVDPLAIPDLTPLASLLSAPNVVKVFHAGSQDLEIFFREFGLATAPVFDTQLAATLAGFPQQVGYGALVKETLGVSLDKGDTYTDWSKRPLSGTQIEYAMNDVRYLPSLYRTLHDELERGNRLTWLADDFAELSDPATYMVDPDEQWRRLKRLSSLNRRQLAMAREVAAWREREAQRRNVPKRWLLGDEAVIEIARRSPKGPNDLEAIRGVSDKLPKAAYRSVLEAVQAGLKVPDEELPSLPKRKRPAQDIDGAVDLMVALTRLRAREHGVAMPLLASRADLERLAAGDREASPLLEGWRATMLGNELVNLLDGGLALGLRDGQLTVSPAERTERTDKRKGNRR